MTTNTILYPATPVNVPDSVTKVSPAFKKEVSGVMGSIVLFFVVYFILFALSIGLVIASVYGGIALIVAVPRLLTIFVGLGLVGLGIMVFVFLVKFLFAVSKHDNSGSVEITEAEQPGLFEFIRQLTKDVATPFPKKIYLSPDVNAAVFYNSSFWSMFLPIRKNLQIGLGLVNSLNVSEFKAVMAHEFGHFSQRSMKLGSFVYNVNKIIHNMLFQNQGYSNALSGWGNVDGIFAIFAQITAGIARSIQWILGQVYGVINKSYMRLSREMEFHADAVAASVSGSSSLVTALRRIEFASTGYNITMQKCDELFKQKKISSNIYQNQKAVLKHMAQDFKLDIEHGIPVVNEKFHQENNISRVNFKDQWASHPATEDRVKHLNDLAVNAAIINEPAWVLFDDPEKLQAELTEKVYQNVPKDRETKTIDNQEFEQRLSADLSRLSYPDEYNGFYDNRQIAVMDVDIMTNNENTNDTFDEMFAPHNASLQKKINSTATDIEIVKAINDKRLQAKTFDFDGVKYKKSEAPQVLALLESEFEKQKTELKQLDRKAVHFFINKAAHKGTQEADDLKKSYNAYFESRKQADEFLKDINNMLDSLHLVFSGQTIPIDQINPLIANLKSHHERKFKDWLKQWLAQGFLDRQPELKSKVQKFIDTNYAYFSGTSFFDSELFELNELCHESWDAVNVLLFEQFKAILQTQLALKD
jgi:Zn-dependent protease with chaperone function